MTSRMDLARAVLEQLTAAERALLVDYSATTYRERLDLQRRLERDGVEPHLVQRLIERGR